MKHDPVSLARRVPDKPVAEMTDAELDAWMETIPPAPGIQYVDDPWTEDEDQALADYKAGRCHDHAVVSRWLKTWGKPDWKPFEEWLADQDG